MSPLDLLDWRRRVTALHEQVRAEVYPYVAHAGWAAVRDQLFAEHPSSPVVPDSFHGLPVADYDPAWRALVRLEAAPEIRVELETTLGGRVPAVRAGVLRTPWGELDAWQLLSYGGGLWIPVGQRVLYDTVEGVDLGTLDDGELVLDLNFLHPPLAHHDPRRESLVAPDDGLPVDVPVGELLS